MAGMPKLVDFRQFPIPVMFVGLTKLALPIRSGQELHFHVVSGGLATHFRGPLATALLLFGRNLRFPQREAEIINVHVFIFASPSEQQVVPRKGLLVYVPRPPPLQRPASHK